jgi:hypothetical protein
MGKPHFWHPNVIHLHDIVTPFVNGEESGPDKEIGAPPCKDEMGNGALGT